MQQGAQHTGREYQTGSTPPLPESLTRPPHTPGAPTRTRPSQTRGATFPRAESVHATENGQPLGGTGSAEPLPDDGAGTGKHDTMSVNKNCLPSRAGPHCPHEPGPATHKDELHRNVLRALRSHRRCSTLPGMAMRVGHARTVCLDYAGGSRTGRGGSDRSEGDGAEHNCVLRFTKASGKADIVPTKPQFGAILCTSVRVQYLFFSKLVRDSFLLSSALSPAVWPSGFSPPTFDDGARPVPDSVRSAAHSCISSASTAGRVSAGRRRVHGAREGGAAPAHAQCAGV